MSLANLFNNFFRPKWMHSDWLVRKAAVEKLTDQAVLAKIAKTDSDWRVRTVAFEKLTGAIAKLTDQAVLAEIAKTGSESLVRKVAVRKLTAQALLAEIAKTDSESDVRKEAVEKLTDQAVLAKIAKTDSESDVRREAVKNLTDQAVLAEIAKTNSSHGIRQVAEKKLAEITKTGSDDGEDLLASYMDKRSFKEVKQMLRESTGARDLFRKAQQAGFRVEEENILGIMMERNGCWINLAASKQDKIKNLFLKEGDLDAISLVENGEFLF